MSSHGSPVRHSLLRGHFPREFNSTSIFTAKLSDHCTTTEHALNWSDNRLIQFNISIVSFIISWAGALIAVSLELNIMFIFGHPLSQILLNTAVGVQVDHSSDSRDKLFPMEKQRRRQLLMCAVWEYRARHLLTRKTKGDYSFEIIFMFRNSIDIGYIYLVDYQLSDLVKSV